ncbi:hypothetical protein LI951_07105 [Enterococcus sp. BWT-B8]|uniref:hypothetical protein n=1 Tax=Enterococcus sp. BWT-B8 TaxID=2885157 RepID=UPI001E5EED5D|nr:hypothetical protein [Enterococcus sp. BWT-B8]MCB5951828.1 hypothetical protein [Enterococcus sp. BWT-B8]
MKKIILSFLVFGAVVSLAACNSSEDKTDISSSTNETAITSTIESTEDSSSIEDKKMEDMAADLEEKGVKVARYSDFLKFTREKGIDYDYFDMTIIIDSKNKEILEITLTLKGNIDGKEKDSLYYRISQNRIVEAPYSNTDITAMAKVLESLGYSDQEFVEFALWYYENNK